MLENGSDVLGAAGEVVVAVDEVSALEKRVVIALTVAVMVPAMFGIAPTTPSQTVYPLCVWMSAPIQLEMTHCREPSPIVKPEKVGLVQRKLMSAVDVQTWVL